MFVKKYDHFKEIYFSLSTNIWIIAKSYLLTWHGYALVLFHPATYGTL